jgi:hypothetical protein
VIRTLSRYLVVLTLAALATCARAAPITFTWQGWGTGTVNGAAFTDQSFLITVVTDTGLVIDDPFSAHGDISYIDPVAATVDIAGVGLATFTDPKCVLVNRTYGAIAFEQSGTLKDYLDLIDPVFATYGLDSPIGPVTGEPRALWQWIGLASDLGPITMSEGRDVTFIASMSTVPEPSSAALLLCGGLAGGLFLVRRRK